MPTETLPTRAEAKPEAALSTGLFWAILLHAAVFGLLAGWAFVLHERNPHFGDAVPIAGSIQASVVSSLPLPPRQLFKDHEVLTSDNPNIAPTPPQPTPKTAPTAAKPATAPPPKPNEILLPNHTQPTPPKPTPADRTQPTPTHRNATPPPPTPKATTGQTAGVQIPQSVTPLKNGTAAITVEERSFGDRYAYYIRLISQKVNQQWTQEQTAADVRASNGRSTTIIFTIDRDGTPTDVHIGTRSGSPTLDTAGLRSIQRIDTFGPLPAGNQITIDFTFNFKAL